jgi:hypothetical protein
VQDQPARVTLATSVSDRDDAAKSREANRRPADPNVVSKHPNMRDWLSLQFE